MNFKSVATNALLVSVFCGALATSAKAQVASAGTCTTSGPGYDSGSGVVSASAIGNLYAIITGPVYWKVRLEVDGVLIWTNDPNPKSLGLVLPTVWPGLVFDYEPAIYYPLSSGTHTLTWTGTINPMFLPDIPPGDFSSTTVVVVP